MVHSYVGGLLVAAGAALAEARFASVRRGGHRGGAATTVAAAGAEGGARAGRPAALQELHR
jgi:hypothetical protein